MEAARRWIPAVAGPLLIAASTIFRLRDILFGGLVSRRNLDLLAAFFPWHCHLGRSLAEGTIPSWNPYVMGGAPFAADPQSGWMFLPAMASYAALPCTDAVRIFLVLHPLIAGLALYAFLRTEGASRPAATTGALALAFVLSLPRLLYAVPFVSALAWTAVMLAMAARFVRSPSWPPRIGWLVATALAWGQVAAAHMSHGLLIGSATILAYLVASLRREREGLPRRLVLVGLLLVALPAVNLAVLLPRLAYLPETSITLGYDELRAASSTPLLEHTLPLGWGASLVRPGRQYMGAVVAVLGLGVLASQRFRRLALAFAALGAAGYLLSVRGVARALAPVALRVPFGDVYLHAPRRLGLVVPLVLAVLAGLAVQAWLSERSPRKRWPLLAPALLTLVAPAVAARSPGPVVFVVAVSVVIAALWLVAHRPSLALVVPLVLALEMTAGSRFGASEPTVPEPVVAAQLDDRPPMLDAITRGPGASRVVTLEASEVEQRFRASLWAHVMRIEEAQGYNPVQPRRYWRLIHERNPRPTEHNSAVLLEPDPLAMDLLGVGWVVSARGDDLPGWVLEDRSGGFWLFSREPPPRAEIVPTWRVVRGEEAARRAVTAPGFDGSRLAILERHPGLRPEGAATDGRAEFRWTGEGQATLDVRVASPALVLIRNSHDPRWTARIGSKAVPILRADYLLQAVAVPAGRSRVSLAYRDPTIGYGALGSLLSLLGALAAATLLRRRSPATRRTR